MESKIKRDNEKAAIGYMNFTKLKFAKCPHCGSPVELPSENKCLGCSYVDEIAASILSTVNEIDKLKREIFESQDRILLLNTRLMLDRAELRAKSSAKLQRMEKNNWTTSE